MAPEMITIKAAGDWELDVLGVPYGDASNRDSDGEWFDSETRLHDDKFGLPPVVYYHGMTESGKPDGQPQYIGKTVRRWVDQAGVWFRVVLDRANEYAKRVWEAAQAGSARASSGSVAHLARVGTDGHIVEWPVAELSVFDAAGRRQPANRYAVAVPVAKALYERAGIDWPDSDEPETEPDAEQAAPVVRVTPKTITKETLMEEQVDIKAAVAEALKAEREAQAAEAKRQAEEQAAFDARVQEAVKAAVAELEEKLTAANRLPVADKGIGVNVINDRKYDSLSAADLGVMIGTLKASRAPVSEDALKALAYRVSNEEGQRSEANQRAWRELQYAAGKAIKANEIHQSTLSNYGDQWVGVQYSNSLWESIRAGSFVLDRLPKIEVPQGHESIVIPLESTDPTWYKVSQAASLPTTEATGTPNATITSSQIGTGNRTLSLAKIGARVLYSGEMDEDSLIPFAPQLRMQLQVSGQEQMEHVVIDGDTTTTTLTNINDSAGTPGGTESFLLVDGFRKLALVTNTANSRSASGSLADTDYLETAWMLGTAGIGGADVAKVTLIVDPSTYKKSLQLATLKTKDVWTQATMEGGKLTGVWGYEVKPSWQMHRGSATRLAQSNGYLDIDTTTNNAYGAILAVRWDQWLFGWRRQMTMETTRIANADTTEIVAMARFGLVYRDTEASAITYCVGV